MDRLRAADLTLGFTWTSLALLLRSHQSTIAAEMSKSAKWAHLSRVLESHVHSIQETFQMLEHSAGSSLDKVDWSEVTKLGDEVSKQATMAGMLWSGEAPDAKALEENMGAYCNIIHGFVLLCYGSTVGAGPTLHASIYASAKQVVDCSLALLREAVSYESHVHEKRTESTSDEEGDLTEADIGDDLSARGDGNCTMIISVVSDTLAVIKALIRFITGLLKSSSLKISSKESTDSLCAASDDLGDGVSNKAAESTSDEEGDLTEADIGDDLSAEEMAIAQLIISVVSDTLAVIKELIRFITGLLKSSSLKISSKESTDSLEKLLSFCREMGQEVNELGACVYPPQEISQMKLSGNKMHRLVDKMHLEVESLEGSPDGVYGTFKQLESSLGNLQHGLGGDLTAEMGRLAVVRQNKPKKRNSNGPNV
ncbi:hypothetical protein C4D60_Mb02t09500 [Musa balbisiana]|uniref:Uncharacterized protein n=1 Tax=Musa balbisiana TaxID=52838 RepID=A0A4S8I9F6_MUSBA|nr:hypothetical protein C4D60_Mb02t09500 [Musa balbisiana]